MIVNRRNIKLIENISKNTMLSSIFDFSASGEKLYVIKNKKIIETVLPKNHFSVFIT